MIASGVLASAYFASPVWLQNLVVSAFGYRLRRLRYGGIHDHTLGLLRRSQWASGDEIRQKQLTLLSRTVHHASERIPLYRSRGVARKAFEDLTQLRELPFLTKEDLRAPREWLIPASFPRRRLLEVHTGGTTGKPLKIYCDRGALQRNYAFFSRFQEWTGAGTGGRVATFAGRTIVSPQQREPPYWRWNAAMDQMLFSSYHIALDTVPDYVQALRSLQPSVIDSYPSSICPIAQYMIRRGIDDLRPAAVITSSETLSLETRRLIEKAFSCKVFDYYGAAEMAAFIPQCDQGTYHVNPEFGIVEIIRDGMPVSAGEAGEIVATGFINRVMPLIRYRTGDIAVQGDEFCECGRAFPTLKQIEGRMDDVIVTPEGRRIGRLDPVFKAVSSIVETRIVQDRPDHVRVEVVALESFWASERNSLERELALRLGPSMEIEIVQVQRIPRGASGKRRVVVNEVGEHD